MIYLDYNTTCPMDKKHINAVMDALMRIKGNAASEHIGGDATKNAMAEARSSLASLLGAETSEIIFCSGATEGNNIACNGILESFLHDAPFDPEIIISAGEHVSMRLPAERWENLGVAKVHYSPLKSSGEVDDAALLKLVNPHTVFVGLMHVNNETGVPNDLASIGTKIKQKNARLHLHSDGVQGLGKLDCTWIGKSNIDSYTFSSHKLGGFPGVGAIFLKNGKNLRPTLLGGSQEAGRRAGTENIPGIISLGLRALELKNGLAWLGEASALGEAFKADLEKIPGVVLHGIHSLPTCANFHIDNVSLHTILAEFKKEKICAAAGAAFSATETKPSKTLLAMGYSKWVAGNSIRISFGRENTRQDIESVANIIRRLAKARAH